MTTIRLKKHHDKRLHRGHHWVFSNEIATIEGDATPGDVCRVFDAFGKSLGTGYYHPNSLIAFRLLSRNEVEIDSDFYLNRVQTAVNSRNQLRPGAQALRLVHGESDGLPGLVADYIGNVLSIQVISVGIENHLNWVVDAFNAVLNPEYIVLRNDSGLRNLEGLPQYVRVEKGAEPIPVQTITEHGIQYEIDVQEGQKTGFYVDQHENRLQFRRFVKSGDHVLDAFCNDGGFALHAASAGAESVLGIDISQPALDRARHNSKLNNVEDVIEFERADLMKRLPEMASQPDRLYDVINLDPPGFAKNRKTAAAALKGYQKLHEAALRLVKNEGFIATATCSHHIETARFVETMTEAARRTGKSVVLIHRGSQPVDHPVLPTMPETEYLRFFVYQVKEF